MENTAAASGPLRMGVVAFLVLRIIVDLCVVRLWGSLQGLLLVPQALHFKPEPLNFHVKILLLFWWARLVMMRQPPICNPLSISGVLRYPSCRFVSIHC